MHCKCSVHNSAQCSNSKMYARRPYEGERMKSEENPNNASMYMHNECEANEAQLQKCGRMWQSENAQRLPMQMRNSSSQSHVIFESPNDVLLIRYPRVYFSHVCVPFYGLQSCLLYPLSPRPPALNAILGLGLGSPHKYWALFFL